MKYKILRDGTGYYQGLFSVDGDLWMTIHDHKLGQTKQFNDFDSVMAELERTAAIYESVEVIAQGLI